MPEREFELYLSLLSRFLRLRPAQRDEVADELRDHLDQRLEELAARGLSREEAIHKALEEFGDAAELAKHFTQAAHVRRRRLIMRCTYGTIAALAAALFIAPAFWPATPRNPIARQAEAQNAAKASAAGALVDEAARAQKRDMPYIMNVGAVEKKIFATLDAPTEVSFVETTLEDALRYLQDFHNINVWVDKPTLTDSLEQPITLQVAGVSFRSVLKLLLEPQQLTYVVEDEVMKITTRTNAGNVIGVYDIRDLVGKNPPPLAAGGPEKTALKSVDDDAAAARGGAARSGMGRPNPTRRIPVSYETTSFAELVARTIYPETWMEAGGSGSVTLYEGRLVVRNTQTVQDSVRSFIKLMRIVRDDDPAKP